MNKDEYEAHQPRIIIYLDIDGVLNAFSKDKSLQMLTGYSSYRNIDVRGRHPLSSEDEYFPIRYAPELIEVLNEINDFPGVTFKWATTWVDNARESLSPAIGLHGEQWEALRPRFSEVRYGGNFWKFRAVREDFLKERPDFAYWIDDDLSFVEEAMRWVEETPNLVGISPDTAEGLKRNELNGLLLDIQQRVLGSPGKD